MLIRADPVLPSGGEEIPTGSDAEDWVRFGNSLLSVSLTPFANPDTFNQSLARLAVKDTPATHSQPEQRGMKPGELLHIADPGL